MAAELADVAVSASARGVPVSLGAQRAVLLSKHLRYHGRAPLIEPYEQQFVPSLATDNSIIHRDYFPSNNIMVQNGVVMPINKGATCIAVRELDLAARTFGWPDEIEHECKKSLHAGRMTQRRT